MRGTAIRVDINRVIEQAYDLWVECRLVDAQGHIWHFHDKVQIFSTDDLNAESAFPRPGLIACEVIERNVRSDGRAVVMVNTERPWGVDSTTGATQFEVFAEQLLEDGEW